MPEYSGQERREHIRLAQGFPVEFVVFDTTREGSILDAEESAKIRGGLMKDISATGLAMETDELKDEWIETLPYGTMKLGLQIFLPRSAAPLKAIAQVRWIKRRESQLSTQKRYALGLQFQDIQTSSKERIQDYILRSFITGGK